MKPRDHIVYELDDMKEVTPIPSLNLPDLTVSQCLQPKDGSRYMVFFCTAAKKYEGPCPCCGSVTTPPIKSGFLKPDRLVHDVMVGLDKVDLVVKTPRYQCKDCGGYFPHPFETICEGKQCTKRLREQIQNDCFLRSFTDVAMMTGYTIPTIINMFDEAIDEMEAKRPPIVAPRILSLDEKHINHRMRAVFVDNDTGRLLEMTEDNKRDTVLHVIENMIDYDKNIKVVTTDMANGYRSAIHECLPYAVIVIDKFHIFQELYRKMTKTKSKIMALTDQQIKDEPDRATADHLREVRDMIVRNNFLFKFGRKKLAEKPERIQVLADACQTFPDFNHLRLIKEGFERMYEAETRADAERLYEELAKLLPPTRKALIPEWEATYGVKFSTFEDLCAFARTMKNWHKEIFAYFDPNCRVTNAVAEGTNSLVQHLNAAGNGYGFKHLRAKAIFWQDIGNRTSYRIQTRKNPIYKPASTGGTPSFSFSYSPLGQNPNMRIVGWQEISEIISETEVKNHKPLSVLSYVPKDAEYYEFEDN